MQGRWCRRRARESGNSRQEVIQGFPTPGGFQVIACMMQGEEEQPCIKAAQLLRTGMSQLYHTPLACCHLQPPALEGLSQRGKKPTLIHKPESPCKLCRPITNTLLLAKHEEVHQRRLISIHHREIKSPHGQCLFLYRCQTEAWFHA